MANTVSSNSNPVSIIFNDYEAAVMWADAHPEMYLTIWGETMNGKVRGSFVLRKKAEQQNAELPTL